ncbi:MAG: hypothetical protein ABFS18_12005 [Thermodesulfobacteriota bacterium]
MQTNSNLLLPGQAALILSPINLELKYNSPPNNANRKLVPAPGLPDKTSAKASHLHFFKVLAMTTLYHANSSPCKYFIPSQAISADVFFERYDACPTTNHPLANKTNTRTQLEQSIAGKIQPARLW